MPAAGVPTGTVALGEVIIGGAAAGCAALVLRGVETTSCARDGWDAGAAREESVETGLDGVSVGSITARGVRSVTVATSSRDMNVAAVASAFLNSSAV